MADNTPANYTKRPLVKENQDAMSFVLGYLANVDKVNIQEPEGGRSGRYGSSIDFLANGRKIQFVADKRLATSGNVALEIISQSEPPVLGWLFTSQADMLFYYDTVNRRAHLFSVAALKRGYTEYPVAKLNMSHVATATRSRVRGFSSDCALIPLKELIKWNGINYHTIDMSKYVPKPLVTPGGAAAQVVKNAENRVDLTVTVGGQVVKQYTLPLDMLEGIIKA